ncbi:KAP family NTPase [Lysobacter capsici]|uniref:KAP family NTPase n=1 Tax=Lysobacter capsici TaxID=435897 RepID=UPI00177ECDF4|nr:KAP family NTPase [Lysobacter capsici]UOF14265.1 KAP family NTPase [Lysobacter capsici]
MTAAKPAMKMPELPVFARLISIGFIVAEIWQIAFDLGLNSISLWTDLALYAQIAGALVVLMLCLTYAMKRSAHLVAARMVRSLRVDLLIAVGIGIWTNQLASPWLAIFHAAVKKADPYWTPAILLLLCAILLSPLIQQWLSRSQKDIPQLYFIADEEIGGEKDDLLASSTQAKSFAETILASCAHQGLVFGVDGPWGVGKTSFINLAAHYLENAGDRVIVCRFEPLRYASESDLADRLIRDLSTTIQRKVFAPEFRPVASRYSRLIKGKADVSFLGFKISLEPSQETIDELLEDVDDVLRRINRRVIIVIDDLDRLDAKAVNNVLFATRRTFKLSQATYVLCYDTEVLVGGQEDVGRAREFLEKFVTVKQSLFIDSSSIRDFLRRDWQQSENQLGSVPSDTMLKLGSVLNELADILDGELAAKYLPFVGDLRKVKRFVNAMLLMQLEKTDLGRTDFNKCDLINLILLHLHYPGLFRRLYAEETEGRLGIFSVRRESREQQFKNSAEFSILLKDQQERASFLLMQLFDVATLGFDGIDVDEEALASRACFNQRSSRNLERYLKLIVRFATPEPQKTFVLYQDAVARVRKGESIASVLASPVFALEKGEYAHDQFWSVLVNQSHSFTYAVAEDAIDTLVSYIPRYSMIAKDGWGLRHRSIYSLLRLLDRAGWGRSSGRRPTNTPGNVLEIAWRIFGEGPYKGKGLLQQLAGASYGILGWNDLMLFRLQCSADRQGQLYNLQSALILHQDENAATTGVTRNLAIMGMRRLSQEVFALFRQSYIDPQRNFLSEVDHAPVEAFIGEDLSRFNRQSPKSDQAQQDFALLSQQISSARSLVKSFVIYQLSNSLPPGGSGVGCGYYDEYEASDDGGIARLMNRYVFDVCFNPEIQEDNVFHFLDHCLSHLSNSFYSDDERDGYFATKASLPGGLNPIDMGRYWKRHERIVRRLAMNFKERSVVTSNYIASYRDDLEGVFDVLDELAGEAAAVKKESGK